MNALRLKRGDPLRLAGLIQQPPRPPGGWAGYSLKAQARALDSAGLPTGDVLGTFAWAWPDRSTDAFTLTLDTGASAFATVTGFGFDVVLIAPDGSPATTTDHAVVHLLDRFSTP